MLDVGECNCGKVTITDTAKSSIFSATVLSKDANADTLAMLYVSRKDAQNSFVNRIAQRLQIKDREVIEPRSLRAKAKAHATDLLNLVLSLISLAALYLEYVRLTATSH